MDIYTIVVSRLVFLLSLYVYLVEKKRVSFHCLNHTSNEQETHTEQIRSKRMNEMGRPRQGREIKGGDGDGDWEDERRTENEERR